MSNSTTRRTGILASLLLAAMGSGTATATVIDAAAGYQDTVSVRGTRYDVRTFSSAEAGVVTLTLVDLNWKDLLQTLSTSISLSTGQQLSMSGGVLMFNLGSGQHFTTSTYARTLPTRTLGLYSMSMSFQAGSPVPLPAGGWLLLGGLSLLASRMRRAARAGSA